MMKKTSRTWGERLRRTPQVFVFSRDHDLFINPPYFQSCPSPLLSLCSIMATTAEEERAERLAQSAAASVKAGNFTDAARALREATTIASENPHVKAGWLSLREEESKSPLLQICRTWVKS